MQLRIVPALISLGIGLFIWFVIPVPEGVDANAWHLLAIFIATIIAIIGKALPIGAIAIIAIMMVALTGVTNPSPKGAIKDALSSFSAPLIWLIGFAVMISRGILKTGLGARIGYYFISVFGKRTLGIAYSLAITEVLLAPVTPSNTARGGGIVHPIMRAIADSFDSSPEKGTEKKLGEFLALVNFQANPITSAMFITATAPNPLVVDIVAKVTNSDISLSWGTWALAMFVPGMVAILLMPLVVYLISPPEIKKTPDATGFAKARLAEMGPMSTHEKIMISVFMLLLFLWAGIPAKIFGDVAVVEATTTAMIGLVVLLVTGVLTWDDVLKEKSAWDTVVWFSALVMMANFLNKLGLISWFADTIKVQMEALMLPWYLSMAILTLIYLYCHYFFASTTAHVTAMLAGFYATGIALGAPPMLFALVLAAAGNIMMSLTHYATGTAPVIFGSNYVTLSRWWGIGFIMSVINLIIWGTVGLLWWKILQFW